RASAALLRQAMPARIPLLLWAARANALALHHALCSRAAVATAHRLGVPVLVWTVNDSASAQRFTALGVDGIVSDDPGSLRATLPVPGSAGAPSRTVTADITTSTATTTVATTTSETTTGTTTTAPTTTTSPAPLGKELPPGVRVAGVRVGGLEPDDAVDTVRQAFSTPLPVIVERTKLLLDPTRVASAYAATAVARARISPSGTNVALAVAVHRPALNAWVAAVEKRFARTPVEATLTFRDARPLIRHDRPGRTLSAKLLAQRV